MKKSEKITPNARKKPQYIFRLYVAGNEPNSQLARENLKRICNKYLKDQCQIEEVDVMIDFASALKDRIFVTPTLILVEPEARVIVIGNLGDEDRVISALRLRI
jgi:circadian clock protein KaiB